MVKGVIIVTTEHGHAIRKLLHVPQQGNIVKFQIKALDSDAFNRLSKGLIIFHAGLHFFGVKRILSLKIGCVQQ